MAKQIHAFDFSNEMLNIAQKKITNKNVNFFKHDITITWPFKDKTADFVIINLVLEHIEKIQLVYDQAYRVLKSGGIFYLCELHPDKQKKGTQAKFQNPEFEDIYKIDAYLHTKKEFENIAKSAGFKNITCKDWYDTDKKTKSPRLITFVMKK